ncbi:ion-transporting P-type ATPase [Paratrimastix pyriformis]|uniref:Ion-transporting P-type ATPase n=1 Tax=Paratrimastix pyriformis TaxID=342808 RepID=A0ABQ8ULM8_9EUKA|nr:ion-transporting P-type ATPase [Paratrimastix pyriformis]
MLSIAVSVTKEPMFLLLLACAIIYFCLGDIGEACMLLFFVLCVISMTIYEERRTEKALSALRSLSPPQAIVLRDGTPRRIPSSEVVVDDIVLISEGDRVPADGILIPPSVALMVDESLLTGESTPVAKHPLHDSGSPSTPSIPEQSSVATGPPSPSIPIGSIYPNACPSPPPEIFTMPEGFVQHPASENRSPATSLSAPLLGEGETEQVPASRGWSGPTILKRILSASPLSSAATQPAPSPLATPGPVFPSRGLPGSEHTPHHHTDNHSVLYSGTLVVQGHGRLRIIVCSSTWFFLPSLINTHLVAIQQPDPPQAVGAQTELGRIGKSLEALHQEKTPLELETQRLVKYMAIFGSGCAVLVALIYIVQRGSVLLALQSGIALAMALLPEEFPVILTVFLALGSWRISRRNILTKRKQAIETLGAATVLCTDKTGTLTTNKMKLQGLMVNGSYMDLAKPHGSFPPAHRELLECGLRASAIRTFDPMEIAMQETAREDPSLMNSVPLPPAMPEGKEASAGLALPPCVDGWALVREYPLDEVPLDRSRSLCVFLQHLLAVTRVWKNIIDPSRYIVATKGAPEAIATLCRMDQAATDVMRAQLSPMCADGLRVLGAATAAFDPSMKLPETPMQFPFRFVGLLGFNDPIRPEVPMAIRECSTAGIRTVMLTGDCPETGPPPPHAATHSEPTWCSEWDAHPSVLYPMVPSGWHAALSVARQLGIPAEKVVTGPEISLMTANELARAIRDVCVFARVRPSQKLKLVEAFKANNEIVAMTGDGTNDAPALKAAHIGIAMGQRGTDVAREAAHLVLLDDSFPSIVAACEMGRRIFDNLRKARGPFSSRFPGDSPLAHPFLSRPGSPAT